MAKRHKSESKPERTRVCWIQRPFFRKKNPPKKLFVLSLYTLMPNSAAITIHAITPDTLSRSLFTLFLFSPSTSWFTILEGQFVQSIKGWWIGFSPAGWFGWRVGRADSFSPQRPEKNEQKRKKKKKREPCISEIQRPGHSLLPLTSAASHKHVSEGQSDALTCSPPPQSSAADSSFKSSATEWLSTHRWHPVLLPLLIFCLLMFPPMHNNSAAENWLSIPWHLLYAARGAARGECHTLKRQKTL